MPARAGRRYAAAVRLLDRYLLRELLVPLLYCLGGFFIFFVSADLMNELPEFQRLKLTGWDIAEYYICKTPELLANVLPMRNEIGRAHV